jgi:hypothetical protein
VGTTVGSIWSLPNLGYSQRFVTVVYSGLNMEGSGLGPLDPSFYFRYLSFLPFEQLSPLYFVVLLLAVVLLAYARWRRKGLRRFLSGVGEPMWVLLLWFAVSMLIFTFSQTMNSRFDVALLPPLALISAYGLCEIRPALARNALISLVVLLGLAQFFALSYDNLAWLRERAMVTMPWEGQVSLLGEGSYVELPSSGRTDARYFVGGAVLDFLMADMQGDGRDSVQLGNLVNRSYSNNAILQYLMYGAYPDIELREFARSGWEEPPFYERLFEVDYLLMKSDPYPGLREHGQEAMDVIESSPSFFEEAFEVVWEHTLPDGDTVYLLKKRYHLGGAYDLVDFRSAVEEITARSEEGDSILLVPGDQVEVVGRYYQGTLPPHPVPRELLLDDTAVAERLTSVISQSDRVFLVLWSGDHVDSGHIVEDWLDEHGERMWDSGYGDLHVVLYDVSVSSR